MVGKYVELPDVYKSINEALLHAGVANNVKVNIDYVDAENWKWWQPVWAYIKLPMPYLFLVDSVSAAPWVNESDSLYLWNNVLIWDLFGMQLSRHWVCAQCIGFRRQLNRVW